MGGWQRWCIGYLVAGSLLAGAVQAGDTVTLTVQGAVTATCELSGPGGAVNLGDLSAPGSHSFNVTVNCNSPFAYAAVSANSALTTSGGTIVLGQFDQSLPYWLTTRFSKNGGGSFGDGAIASSLLTTARAAPCLAASFDISCPFATSGSDVAINQTGTLTVSWGSSTHPLWAGTYTDILTLTVRVL